MDLVAVNNQIVLMRNAVRRAKVHVIRKLTRNISKYKKKKGSEEQLKQNNKRAQNLLEEITVIKKLDADEISKFALINTKKFVEIVPKVKPNDKTRVMTRLSEHSTVKRQVNDFRQKYLGWENQLPYLLKMRLIRSKFKTTNKNPKEKTNEKIKTTKNETSDVDISDEAEICEDPKPKIELTERKRGESEIKRLDLSQENPQNSDEDDSSVDQNEDGKKDFVDFMNEGIDEDAETIAPQPQNPKKRIKSHRKQNKPAIKKSKEIKTIEKPTTTTNSDSLHPSWEAKKRLHQQNIQFRGTKITFDD